MQHRGVVAAGHDLTARTMESVLREGGNAFDAILAGVAVACVAEPILASPGGGGFLLARPADAPSRVYDFFVQTPRSRPSRDIVDIHPVYADFGTARQEFHIGLGAVATPGLIKGFDAIYRDLATMPRREVMAPAVAHARDGVVLNDFQAYAFSVVDSIYTATPGAREVYCSPDHPDRLGKAGETLRLPELSNVLDALAFEGADLFYRGEIARSIIDLCRAGGGCLSMDDLEGYEVALRSPLSVDYRHTRVSTNPPPSSGGILMALALRLLDAIDLSTIPFGSGDHIDLMAVIMEQTNRARVDAEADGTSADGLSGLLDDSLVERYRAEVRQRARAIRGTTHLNVIDDRGNVATLSISNGEGCGHVVPGTGFMLNNMLGEEDLCPQGLHCWPTDQRMTSMMAPTMVQFDNGRTVATGSGGSNRIRTAILQVLANLIDHGMTVEQAVSSPRLFFERGLLNIEAGFDPDEVDSVCRLYLQHELWDELNLFFGGVHTVEAHKGAFHGAGDPRRSGVCLVVG